jgi:hypothetical protein
MVNFVRRPFVSHDQPSDAMCHIIVTVYRDGNISLSSVPSGLLASVSGVPPLSLGWPWFPSEQPSFGIVVENRPNVLRSQVIARRPRISHFGISHSIVLQSGWLGLVEGAYDALPVRSLCGKRSVFAMGYALC